MNYIIIIELTAIGGSRSRQKQAKGEELLFTAVGKMICDYDYTTSDQKNTSQ